GPPRGITPHPVPTAPDGGLPQAFGSTRSTSPWPAPCSTTPSSGTSTATAPSRTATDTADSPLRRHVQWLNTRFRVNTTITVEVMLDPKMTWKSLGKFL